MKFKLVATLMSSALVLSGISPAFSSDAAASAESELSQTRTVKSVTDFTGSNWDVSRSAASPAPIASSVAAFAITTSAEVTSTEPKMKWSSRQWITKFSTLKQRELSVSQKRVLPNLFPALYSSLSIKCVGLHNKQISQNVAAARALVTCLELIKMYPHLSYEVSSRQTKAKIERNVYVRTGSIQYPKSSDLSNRSYENKEDVLLGLQIKPIYLLPKGTRDLEKDVNGTISRYLDEGASFLAAHTGRTLKIDRDQKGNYDIGFIQSSYTEKEILDLSENGFLSWLDNGTNFEADDPKNAGKIFMLFLESDTTFRSYCGLAMLHGAAFVSASGVCAAPHIGFTSYASLMWVHEFMHQIGVQHNNDPCDFMYGIELGVRELTYCSDVKKKVDPENKYYINSNYSGLDIMKYDIWLPVSGK
jgi:hypothetical protein